MNLESTHKELLSVVIPAFNRAQLLQKTLESFKQQTLPAEQFEIIVVDDGSTEDLKQIVDQAKDDSQLTIHYHRQTNQGPAKARNLGVEKAKNKIIALTDSDVIPSKNWLEQGLKIFRKYPEISAIEGKTIIPDKEKITPFTHQTENEDGGRYPTCNFFIRKELCKFSTEYKNCFREDSDLAFTLLSLGHKIRFSPNVVAYHPVLPGSWRTPFRLAKRYEYDALLRKRFPYYYKNILDVHQVAGIGFAHLRKKIYSVFLFTFIAAIISLFSPYKVITTIAIASFLISWAATFFVFMRSTSLKVMGLRGPLSCLILSLIIPFILYYYLIKGFIRFRNVKRFSR